MFIIWGYLGHLTFTVSAGEERNISNTSNAVSAGQQFLPIYIMSRTCKIPVFPEHKFYDFPN